MIWVWLILAGLVAAPLIVEATRTPMNRVTRGPAPGRFARLSQGVTHYQWHGPETGPVVVCVHGLTTPSFVWRGITTGLSRSGIRVLTYDLYGRGYSDRPRGAQDRAFFLRQLDDLLEDQQVHDPFVLVGYSMGGAIATIFAARDPGRAKGLVLLAPAGMTRVGNGFLGAAARMPVVGTWMMLTVYPFMLRKGLAAERHLPSSVPGITDLQAEELTRRGFIPAVRASLAGLLSDDLRAEHSVIRRAGLPVLALWGAGDTVIPLSAADILRNWNDNVRSVVITGAGHGLTYTHTQEVLEQIAPFARRDP